MAIEFIPNQPILFESDTQSCKNNDDTEYAAYLEMDDTLCVQWKLTPCGSDILCNTADPEDNVISNPTFDVGTTGWEVGADWTYGGGGIDPGRVCYKGLPGEITRLFQNVPITPGQPYEITIVVEEGDGGPCGNMAVYFGYKKVFTFSEFGIYTFTATPPLNKGVWIQADPSDNIGGDCCITQITAIPMYQCVDWSSIGDYIVQFTNDFSSGTGWAFGTGWSLVSAKGHHAGAEGTMYHLLTEGTNVTDIMDGNGYWLEFDTVNFATNGVDVSFNNVAIDTFIGTATNDAYFSAQTGIIGGPDPALSLAFASDETGDVDLITIQSWVGDWTYTDEDGFCYNDQTSARPLVFAPINPIGAGYWKITFTMKNYTAGTLTCMLDTQNIPITMVNGVQSVYVDTSTIGPTTELKFIPSYTFNGCIKDVTMELIADLYSINAEMVFTSGEQIRCAHYYDPAAGGLSNVLLLNKDFMTLCFKPNDAYALDCTTPDPYQENCYRIRIYDPCTDTAYLSTTRINLKSSHPCTVWVEATNEGLADGFDWTHFTMGQRLKLLRIKPKWLVKGDSYTYSTGESTHSSKEKEKVYEAWFDYVDEPTLDAIAVQLTSDNMSIDGVDYFYESKDIEPEWTRNMKYNLAQLRVEIKKKIGKLFNRKC